MIKYCEIQFVLKPFCKCLVDEKMARMSIDELNKARKSKNISYEAKRLFDKYGMRDEELYKCTKNIKGFS
ncbi:hypothetical protein [Campylobacter sp. MIT 12-5580]|uniref:hypothetical protein n=1 Tax=Campylobacter sp. MIT 12-5580 TaxID=2040651 RepID=UPI0014854C14|nr:hypothetical protein [Campylobacter sp. MIT 12-5580]